MTRSKSKPNLKLIFLTAFIVVAVAMLLISHFALGMPFVTVGAYVILETLLPSLLKKTPVFIHGIVLIAQIVAGILAKQTLFVILMCVVYVAALATLSAFLEGEN